jgi:hypothetical protein
MEPNETEETPARLDERLQASVRTLADRAKPAVASSWPYVRGLGVRAAPFTLRHGLITCVYMVAVIVLMWPMFAPGSPPGVDSPTFLHLGWVTERALTGDFGAITNDRFWYGGWPYLQAYPPLAYGAVGVISALSPIPIEISFRIIIFLAWVAIGMSVYALCLEFGLHRMIAAWAGFLSLFSYAMFVSLGIFGWFSTVVALPFGVAGFVAIERALRTDDRRMAIVSGLLFAGSMLAHHMTGFAFGLVMVPWVIYRVISSEYPKPLAVRTVLYTGAGFFGLVGVWMVSFLLHVTGVGFEREIAGNWNVDVGDVRQRALSQTWIGREAFPSYIGLVQVPLAALGTMYAFVTRGRAIGAAIALVVFTWFGLGAASMPLINFYPFSGLDVARFIVFMAPFMAVMAAIFLDAVIRELVPVAQHLRVPTSAGIAAVGVAGLALLVVPVQDGLAARATLAPIETIPQVALAMDWLSTETPENATVLAVGFRNWDDWWVPERTGRAVMDGWNDEGAPNWREIREIRHMGWFGRVNSLRLYDLMEKHDTDYLMVYHWQPLDSPQLFEAAVAHDPFLFARRTSWAGLTIFERLDRGF